MILFVARCVGRLISKMVLGAWFNDASVLNRVGEDAIATGGRLVIRSFNDRVDPCEIVLFPMRRAFFRSFRRFLLAFRVNVQFVVGFVRAGSRRLVHFVRSNVCPIVRLLPRNASLEIVHLPLARRLTDFRRREEIYLYLDLDFFFVRTFDLVLDYRFLCLDLMVLIGDCVVIAGRVIPLLAQ